MPCVLSLVTTSISLVVTVVLGLPLAFVLARRGFRGKGIVEAVVDLPIVLPPSVAGLALLLVFGRRGLLSAPFDFLGITVPFTTIAVILAMTFVSAPFFIRSARTGIAGVDRRPRGRRSGGRCLGAPAVPIDHGPARRAPHSPPAWS